jgi:hypothetical protein
MYCDDSQTSSAGINYPPARYDYRDQPHYEGSESEVECPDQSEINECIAYLDSSELPKEPALDSAQGPTIEHQSPQLVETTNRTLQKVLNELDEVRSEASSEGWDGYGARPINPDSYDFAARFLKALPASAPLPEVGADNEGEVSLDWLFGERKALTVAIGPTGRCTFAWMNGKSTSRGTDWIKDEIPAPIVFALGHLAPEAF